MGEVIRHAVAAQLLEQARGLRTWAEAERVVADHFRPRYEAAIDCDESEQGLRTVSLLREYVVVREANAKGMEREAAELEKAASLLSRPATQKGNET